MNLYLVVKHRNDTTTQFRADWSNDTMLNWTECNDKVIADCKQVLNSDRNAWVYIYRPAYAGEKTNMVMCKARIAKIDEPSKKIIFKDQTPVNTAATFTVENGTFSKWLDGGNAHSTKGGKMKKTA